MPIFLILFIIFIIWLTYERKKASKINSKISQSFWEREQRANHTRNKDISHLKPISIEESRIPKVETDNTDIHEVRQTVVSAAQNTLMDLSSYSNTDLKLKYGVGNFHKLSSYDANYTNFLIKLSRYSNVLFEEKFFQAAIEGYKLLLEIGSVRSADYYGLAKSYLALGQKDEYHNIIRQISESDLDRKEKILIGLRELQDNDQT
jgi:hypothetical protein